MAGQGLFEVPTSLAGQTLSQITSGKGRSAEDLAAKAGFAPNQALTAGQTFSIYNPTDPTTFKDFVELGFTPTTAEAPVERALAASKPITEQAYAERQRQIEGEKQPLMDRYQSIIDDLKGRETKEAATQGRVLGSEYGKRGIPLSSTAYQQDLAGKTGDISQFYGGQIKDVGFEREDKLRSISNMLADLPIERAQELNQIDKQIALLKMQGMDNAQLRNIEAYKLQREEYWKQQDQDLQKQAFQLKLYEGGVPSSYGTKPASSSLSDSFTSLGEGSTLFNLLTGQPVYTAPKQYKASGGGAGGGNNDPLGLF